MLSSRRGFGPERAGLIRLSRLRQPALRESLGVRLARISRCRGSSWLRPLTIA